MRTRIACIDGFAFRAAKFWGSQLIDSVCASLDDIKPEGRLCRSVARAGMYSVRKERIFEMTLSE